MNEDKDIQVLGNVSDTNTQSRTVYDIEGICPTLCAGMDHGNTVPYIIFGDDFYDE